MENGELSHDPRWPNAENELRKEGKKRMDQTSSHHGNQEQSIPTRTKPTDPYVCVRNEILQRVQEKRYVVGSLLSYEDLKPYAKSKTHYERALYFLEGAGVAVNSVIITDKISKDLVKRVGLVHE